jgi:hypothetical protein
LSISSTENTFSFSIGGGSCMTSSSVSTRPRAGWSLEVTVYSTLLLRLRLYSSDSYSGSESNLLWRSMDGEVLEKARVATVGA